MGLIKDTKANVAGKHANRARNEGHTILVYRLETRGSVVGPVPSWAEQIEAIEAEGWRLEHFTAVGENTANLVFRPTQ